MIDGSCPATVRVEKLEIHTVFLRFFKLSFAEKSLADHTCRLNHRLLKKSGFTRGFSNRAFLVYAVSAAGKCLFVQYNIIAAERVPPQAVFTIDLFLFYERLLYTGEQNGQFWWSADCGFRSLRRFQMEKSKICTSQRSCQDVQVLCRNHHMPF